MLDWEENLFLGLKALHRRFVLGPRAQQRRKIVVRLRDHRHSLLLLAQMVARRPLAIFETIDPVLHRDDRIFLPPEFALARSKEANQSFYELKTLYAALSLRDGWPASPATFDQTTQRYRAEFPALDEKLARLRSDLPPDPGFALLLGSSDRSPGAISLDDTPATTPSPAAGISRVTTEIEGKGSSEVTVLPARDDDGTGAEVPMHTFEKVETAEEYNGLSRKSDDADELEEQAEALSELKLSQVIRSAERPRSIYRSDIILDGLALEMQDPTDGSGIPYPEWNHHQRRYRPDWCRVHAVDAEPGAADWATTTEIRHRRLIRQLRGQFAQLTSEWLRQRRQPFGEEFDLDAVIDSEVERRTGHSPTEAIYLDRRRDVHDIAALILLDESYSTDAWIENRRVLDIIRESVFCVGEVLESDIETFAVAAFSSNTRRSCRFKTIKDFHQPWARSRNRLGSLEPQGYTRIGPALRHAQELLARERARRKMIILLTDGRPCDYDRYEGTYGIKDVKKAIDVGIENGIHTHAFAVEKQAAEFFPRMFTHDHYDILPHPDRLAQTVCRLFGRLLAR